MEWSWLRHSSLLRFSVTMYDYQAMCEPPDHRHSAAQALISVSDPQAVFLLGHILYPVLQDVTWSHPHPAPDLALANQDPVLMLTPSPGAVGLSCGGGCSSSPPRLTSTSSGVPKTGLSEMGNDQTPEGFFKSHL